MKIKLVVIVYDRFNNVQEWIRCYKLCNLPEETEFIVIHNYKDEKDRLKFKVFCEDNGVKHVSRKNIGTDIGALQDVCRERLVDFPDEWDYLIWFTDDVMPMRRDFISPFLAGMKNPDVGVVCNEVSEEVKTHIRTTCFMIDKQTLLEINFPADPITTKAQCYGFEHRFTDAFYEQVISLGKKVLQVCPLLSDAPAWDIGHRGGLHRWPEHFKEFPNV